MEPTDKQKQEARIVEDFCDKWGWIPEPAMLLDLGERISIGLSTRDAEVREVLEGLRLPFSGCWCQTWSVQHTPACLATQRLWERVRG